MTHFRVSIQPMVFHCLPHIPSISHFLFGSFSSVETGTHLTYSHENISFDSLKTWKSPPHDVIHSQVWILHLSSNIRFTRGRGGGFSDKVTSWLLAQQCHDQNVLTLYWHFPWSPASKEAELGVAHHRIHNISSSFECGLQPTCLRSWR